MTKKKPATKKVAPVEAEPIELEPQDDVPSRQIEEVHETEPEPVAEAEPHPIVEVVAELAPAPVPPSKPKPPTLISVSGELNALRQIIDQQAIFIKQLMETPARQRKSTNNGKIQIRDKQTGKIYKSKNSVYQTMLKAGELKDLVEKGIFGPIPEKNSFGCYALFRAYPDRFEEVREQSV